MKNQMMISAPADWCTVAWAAEHLKVSHRTIWRLIQSGRLTGYMPLCGSRETARTKRILATEEVRRYGKALEVTTGV